MQANPFSRVKAMMQLLAAFASLPMASRSAAIQNIGPYESRGKGKGSSTHPNILSRRSQRKGNTSKYAPGTQGIRECSRRAVQMHNAAYEVERRKWAAVRPS